LADQDHPWKNAGNWYNFGKRFYMLRNYHFLKLLEYFIKQENAHIVSSVDSGTPGSASRFRIFIFHFREDVFFFSRELEPTL
jgi:hypothetical protein